MILSPRLALLVAAPLCALSLSAQSTIVIPNGLANVDGNSSNQFPWGRGGSGIRVQNFYDSSHFTLQGVTTPVLITRLRWRLDAFTNSTAVNYPVGATVTLSTCPVDQAAITNNMAANRGNDATVCYSGPVSWPQTQVSPNPPPFQVDLPLSTPFYYDPAFGDLAIESDLPVQSATGTQVSLDVSTQAPLASRTFMTTGYPNGTVQVAQNHGLVVEVTYTALTGLQSHFTADVVRGPSPLSVQFLDRSWTSAPGGITSWAWDFESDGIVDSTQQNPTHVYTNCGAHDVTLTTTDGINAPATSVRRSFVVTDIVTPSFTFTQLGQGYYMFTDTSTPSPTSWDWDFDGDNVIDATGPVTAFQFASSCTTPTVALTVSRACQGPFTLRRQLVLAPATQQTVLNGGIGQSSTGATNVFELNVTHPGGINVCALTLTPVGSGTLPIGTPLTAQVYVTDAAGGWQANHSNAAAWRLVSTAPGTYGGGVANAPVAVPFALPSPVYLAAGTYGVAVTMNGCGFAYGAPAGPQTYVGADMTIVTGGFKSAPFSATVTANRNWNGIVHYTPMTGSFDAGFGFFGAGCPGTLPVSQLSTGGQRPILGTTLNTQFTNLPQSLLLVMLGFSRTTSSFGPLPIDLGVVGAPGCIGRVSPDLTFFTFGGGNTANWGLGIPSTTTFTGLQIFVQGYVFDPTANALGGVLSDAAAMVLGG